MIGDFIESWTLFQDAWLAGWFIALSLSLIGVVVVARDQIFIGAAVSQASTFGVATGMWFGHFIIGQEYPWFQTHTFHTVMAIGFAVLAAVLTARGGGAGKESYESITGWIFLLSSAGAILIIAKSPHGLEEIQSLISSSIIGAKTGDVWMFASTFVVSTLALMLIRRRLILYAMDPGMAAAAGMRTGLWSLALSAWLGFLIAFSIHASGALYAFGCLVLPGLVAKNICREVGPMFIVSPAVALAGGVSGFVVANDHRLDYPPAQMAVAFLCLFLIASWIYRAVRTRIQAG